MREIDLDHFAAAHAHGAVVIDVREPYEYVAGHVPGARLLPLSKLRQRAATLPRNAALYVICATGNRSLLAVDQLTRLGFEALSVAGGTAAWARGGRSLVLGPRENAA